ncbi:MAG: (4Fe-4S)-binding protein [Anaerolineaceae bacterium]|nr:MAG: (4Fe-4S)-binding protein [Anaerolineaceae bacterium]
MQFSELCHSCGSCSLICPLHAISEKPIVLGKIEKGMVNNLHFLQGVMNIGRSSPVGIINRMFEELFSDNSEDLQNSICIIDAPPGVSCPVVASLQSADLVILVAEPTPFGLHDLRLAVQLVREELKIPFAVILNKDGAGDSGIEDFCRENTIPIIQHLPYSRRIAEIYAEGNLLVEKDSVFKDCFLNIWKEISLILDEIPLESDR